MSLFKAGHHVALKDFFTQKIIKTGTIKYLRDDKWEKENNHIHDKYYYFVNWDDGTSETYQSERDLTTIE